MPKFNERQLKCLETRNILILSINCRKDNMSFLSPLISVWLKSTTDRALQSAKKKLDNLLIKEFKNSSNFTNFQGISEHLYKGIFAYSANN